MAGLGWYFADGARTIQSVHASVACIPFSFLPFDFDDDMVWPVLVLYFAAAAASSSATAAAVDDDGDDDDDAACASTIFYFYLFKLSG